MTTTHLSPTAFDAARRFIETAARPLDVARFRFHFCDGSLRAVLDMLQVYQNPDGGFGHALEPDLRTPESSALCTTVALQLLRTTKSVDVSGEEIAQVHAVSQRAIDYLVTTFNSKSGSWRIIPKEAEDSPHAPWWSQQQNVTRFDVFALNPTAEILGYLYEYRHLVPGKLVALLTKKVATHLQGLEKVEMHDLLCCLRLDETNNLPTAFAEELRTKLTALVAGAVTTDPAEWQEYGLPPLSVVSSPQSSFIAGLETAVAANLDHEISSQNADGSWGPVWTWSEVYPDVWEQARVEWSGTITLEKLLTLQKFERIG